MNRKCYLPQKNMAPDVKTNKTCNHRCQQYFQAVLKFAICVLEHRSTSTINFHGYWFITIQKQLLNKSFLKHESIKEVASVSNWSSKYLTTNFQANWKMIKKHGKFWGWLSGWYYWQQEINQEKGEVASKSTQFSHQLYQLVQKVLQGGETHGGKLTWWYFKNYLSLQDKESRQNKLLPQNFRITPSFLSWLFLQFLQLVLWPEVTHTQPEQEPTPT